MSSSPPGGRPPVLPEGLAGEEAKYQPGRTGSDAPLLDVRDLVVHHGQLQAVAGISLTVYPGEVYALIGANGAGKSTLLRTIAGLHRPTSGTITYEGRDVTGLRPEKRAAAGIVMVPEGRRLFPSMSLEDNLKVGESYARKGPWNRERVFELFPWMKERRGQKTGQMSGGEQQAVAIGRALVANPRVLLLDELSLGLAPVIVQRIYAMLPQVLESGITVLLVEQDVSQALRVATRLQCLLEGRTTLEGTPAQVTREQVEAAYFGAGSVAPGGTPPQTPPRRTGRGATPNGLG
ncbi:MAG TPA: ABC transporter ATP-binding protein [Trebonia sp.]